jgi:hypothetical protein
MRLGGLLVITVIAVSACVPAEAFPEGPAGSVVVENHSAGVVVVKANPGYVPGETSRDGATFVVSPGSNATVGMNGFGDMKPVAFVILLDASCREITRHDFAPDTSPKGGTFTVTDVGATFSTAYTTVSPNASPEDMTGATSSAPPCVWGGSS